MTMPKAPDSLAFAKNLPPVLPPPPTPEMLPPTGPGTPGPAPAPPQPNDSLAQSIKELAATIERNSFTGQLNRMLEFLGNVALIGLLLFGVLMLIHWLL